MRPCLKKNVFNMFICVCVCARNPEEDSYTLKLQVQAVVSCLMCVLEPSSGPLEEKRVLLTALPLQPRAHIQSRRETEKVFQMFCFVSNIIFLLIIREFYIMYPNNTHPSVSPGPPLSLVTPQKSPICVGPILTGAW